MISGEATVHGMLGTPHRVGAGSRKERLEASYTFRRKAGCLPLVRRRVTPIKVGVKYRIEISTKKCGNLKVHKVREGGEETVPVWVPVISVQRCKTHTFLFHQDLDLRETPCVIPPYLG